MKKVIQWSLLALFLAAVLGACWALLNWPTVLALLAFNAAYGGMKGWWEEIRTGLEVRRKERRERRGRRRRRGEPTPADTSTKPEESDNQKKKRRLRDLGDSLRQDLEKLKKKVPRPKRWPDTKEV